MQTMEINEWIRNQMQYIICNYIKKVFKYGKKKHGSIDLFVYLTDCKAKH